MVAKRRKQRVVDFAIYIAIGLLIVVATVALAEYDERLGIPRSDVRKLGIGGLVALLIFPALILQDRMLRRKHGFWPIIGLLLIAHLVLLALIWRVPFEVGARGWGVIAMAEFACGEAILWSLRRR